MAPTFRHGKGAYFSLSDSAGATINYSSGLDSITLNRTGETADVTTFGDNDRNFIPGLRVATISGAGHFASTYEEKLSASLGHSTLLTWVYGPESTSNTRRKLTGSAILTAFSVETPVGDKASMSFELQCTGTVTSTTF